MHTLDLVTSVTPTTSELTTTETEETTEIVEIGDRDIIYRFFDRSMNALCRLFPQLYGKISSLCPQE